LHYWPDEAARAAELTVRSRLERIERRTGQGEVGEFNRVEVREQVDPPTNTTIRTVQRGSVQVRG
jgi:hypothetical protein